MADKTAVDVVEDAGSGVMKLADKLVSEMKSLMSVLGEKADQAIGPATNIVTTLMAQYVEEQKTAAHSLFLTAVGCFVMAAVLALGEACLVIFGAPYVHAGSKDAPIVIMGAIMLGLAVLGFSVSAFFNLAEAFDRQGRMTSSSVDKLINQFSNLRGRR